jgi:class 3 adenylate cyclase
VPDTIRCTTCGHDNDAGQHFCSNCGTELAIVCPRCGTPASPTANFCGACGLDLKHAPAAAMQLPLLEERRVASVLFADLSGYTAMSGHTDPEEVRALLDRCMNLLGDIVDHFGGVVDNVIGDAVLALWGVPIAHEDHAERAVRAALEMQQCARERADDFGGLELRIGINTGELMFAPVGPEGRRHQTVIGDVVNMASRLQTSAPRGGILAGEETWRATRRAIRYEQVEPFVVKGRDTPIDAWLALEALEHDAAERPLSNVPMVGRDDELEVLTGVWSRVVGDHQPHLVVVSGAPGIGKSRLCGEFREIAESDQVTVLKARSLPYGENEPYGAFASLVRLAAGIFDSDDDAAAGTKLRSRVASLPWRGGPAVGAEALEVFIGYVAGRIGNRAVLFDAAARFVEALGTEQPTILGFEDLHWADTSLLDLIEHLAANVRDAPVLLLASARPELFQERPDFGRGLPQYQTLSLDALSDAAADELTRELLRGRALPPAVAERISEAGGGNPLFLEVLATSVAEGTTDPARGLPTSIISIIAARLDGLPPDERRLLLDASVIGRTFWPSLLGLLDPDVDLDRALADLEDRDFIQREGASVLEGDDAYTFRHMSLREVAYNMLPKAERRDRHAAVARLAEAAFPDRSTSLTPILAYHWREAGDTPRAIDAYLRAAEQADQAWAKVEAVRHYRQVLDLLAEGDGRVRTVTMRLALAQVSIDHIRFGDVPAPSSGSEASSPE